MSDKKLCLELITYIYQAIMNHSEWEKLLESLAVFFSGHTAFAFGENIDDRHAPFLAISRIDPTNQRLSDDDYLIKEFRNLFGPRKNLTELETDLFNNSYSQAHSHNHPHFKAPPSFIGLLNELAIEHYIASPFTSNSVVSIIVIGRQFGSEPFSDDEVESLNMIVKHFNKALTILYQLQVFQIQIQTHEKLLNSINQGMLSMTADGKVLYSNNLAVKWLKQQESLTIKNGMLNAATDEINQDLSNLLSAAKQGKSHSFILERLSKEPALLIKNLPLSSKEETDNFLLTKAKTENIVLSLHEVSHTPTCNHQYFAKFYRLTYKETQVLKDLIEGQSIKQIAANYSVSYHTVRSQLASIMSKTDCKTQKDLIRLFLRGY